MNSPLTPLCFAKRGVISTELKKIIFDLMVLLTLENEEYDRFRDFEMKEKGIHVLRLKNEDLLNLNEVLQRISGILELIPYY